MKLETTKNLFKRPFSQIVLEVSSGALAISIFAVGSPRPLCASLEEILGLKSSSRGKKRLRRVFNMKNNRMHLAHDCNMKPFLFGFGSSFDRVIQKNTQHSGKSEQIGGKFCDFLRQLGRKHPADGSSPVPFLYTKDPLISVTLISDRRAKGVVLIDQNAAARDDTGIKIIPEACPYRFPGCSR